MVERSSPPEQVPRGHKEEASSTALLIFKLFPVKYRANDVSVPSAKVTIKERCFQGVQPVRYNLADVKLACRKQCKRVVGLILIRGRRVWTCAVRYGADVRTDQRQLLRPEEPIKVQFAINAPCASQKNNATRVRRCLCSQYECLRAARYLDDDVAGETGCTLRVIGQTDELMRSAA